MARFILRRLVLLVPVILGISLVVFSLIRFAPGDPVHAALGLDYTPELGAQLRREWGLDRTLGAQYLYWFGKAVRGDLGRSIVIREQVRDLIAARLPITLVLALTSMAVAIAVALPLGVVAATRKDTLLDGLSRVAAMAGVSMPTFWVGIVLLAVFALKLRWFPATGSVDEFGLRALVLPAVTLGLAFAALLMRMTRSTMVETLLEQYVRTAWAKGLNPRTVHLRHALRNSLIPIITVVGFEFGAVLGGAVVTETVFNIRGLGRLLMEGVSRRDYPLIQGCVLVTALAFVLVNLLTDVTYAAVDPRIRYD